MNSPENNGRREFLKQAVSTVGALRTYGFLLNKIKYDEPGTPDYEETINLAFETIEREAEMERGIDGSVSNIKANLKRLGLQIELYKKGIAKCSKDDILASLDDDYYCAQQTPGAENMLAEIDRMTERVKNFN
jgi:septation ring formation regulator EzrA